MIVEPRQMIVPTLDLSIDPPTAGAIRHTTPLGGNQATMADHSPVEDGLEVSVFSMTDTIVL
jgi:hypothetical protein